MDIKKILWATDLSENAEKALPFVTSLSEKYQTEVHILYVSEELGRFGASYGDFDRSQIERLQEMEIKDAETRLDEICRASLDSCPLYIRHTCIGDPASEILKLMEKEKPDMVVMAARGRKGRFQIGSVADRVIRHSQIPVLMIPVP